MNLNRFCRRGRNSRDRSLALGAALLATLACTPAVHSQLPAIDALPDSGCATTPATGKRRFDVGPGQTFSELTQVPWLSLRGGDVVNIHYRPEPYRTKLLISAQASARAPIVVNGVTDAQCRRPVITGENAVPSDDAARRGAYNQWTEALATILLWGPWGQKPRFIEIRNLAITGARAGVEFRKQDGGTGRFGAGSSGIHGAAVEDILIENCEISGNGNGIFVNTKNDSEQETSYRITMRRNLLHNNGNVGRWFEHNLYVQAVQPLYEGNYIGQLIPGAVGSSLKDRSSGTIIRYNTIIAAARALDLVETEGGSTTVFRDPAYHDAWVYGNVIISDHTREAVASAKLIHWGGDNTPKYFRNGTLHFYHNTVVTRGDQAGGPWRLHVFDMPGKQKVELRGNVFWHSGSTQLQLGNEHGTLAFADSNWISRGWQLGHDLANDIVMTKSGRLIEGDAPAFGAGFVPAADSPLLDQAAAPPPELASRWIDGQITGLGALGPRRTGGAGPDLGAIERP